MKIDFTDEELDVVDNFINYSGSLMDHMVELEYGPMKGSGFEWDVKFDWLKDLTKQELIVFLDELSNTKGPKDFSEIVNRNFETWVNRL